MSIFELPYKLWYYFQFLGILSIVIWIALAVVTVRYARDNRIQYVLLGAATLTVLVYVTSMAFDLSYHLFVTAWIVLSIMLLIFAISRQRIPCAILILAAISLLIGRANSNEVSAIRRKPSEAELKAAELSRIAMQKERQAAAEEHGSEINVVEEPEVAKPEGESDDESSEPSGEKTDGDESADPKEETGEAEKSGEPTEAAPSEKTGSEPKTEEAPVEDEDSIPAYKLKGKIERNADDIPVDEEGEENAPRDEEEMKERESDFATTVEELAREMEQDDVFRAQRWDRMNLFTVRSMFLVAVVFIVIDYLRRFNRTIDPVLPLPIASRFVDAMFPKTHSVYLRDEDSHTATHYLERAVAKGETFVYFGESDPWEADSLPRVRVFGRVLWGLRKMRFNDNQQVPSSEFVLESVWFDRYAFTVVGEEFAAECVRDLAEFLRMRTVPDATVGRSVNVVWDFETPISSNVLEDLTFLCRKTNFKLLVSSPHIAADDVERCFEEVV